LCVVNRVHGIERRGEERTGPDGYYFVFSHFKHVMKTERLIF
jgi:hypothetical protein